MSHANQPNQLPRLNDQDLKDIKEYVREHLDTTQAAALDFLPDALKRQGFIVAEPQTWKTVAKKTAGYVVAGVAGGIATAVVMRRFQKREKQLSIELETTAEKDTNGHNTRVRTIGTRAAALS